MVTVNMERQGDSLLMVTGAFRACCRIYMVANWISTLDKASRLAI